MDSDAGFLKIGAQKFPMQVAVRYLEARRTESPVTLDHVDITVRDTGWIEDFTEIQPPLGTYVSPRKHPDRPVHRASIRANIPAIGNPSIRTLWLLHTKEIWSGIWHLQAFPSWVYRFQMGISFPVYLETPRDATIAYFEI